MEEEAFSSDPWRIVFYWNAFKANKLSDATVYVPEKLLNEDIAIDASSKDLLYGFRDISGSLRMTKGRGDENLETPPRLLGDQNVNSRYMLYAAFNCKDIH